MNALQDTGGLYMIDAPGGTGKTFTERTITAHPRSHGKLVLCAASTGNAALILPGGFTARSTFKLPFGDDAVDGSVCNVKAESDRANVLRRASLIIWDEVVCPPLRRPSTQHSKAFASVICLSPVKPFYSAETGDKLVLSSSLVLY